MIKDFLNDVRVSDISNNTHGTAAERALVNLQIKNSIIEDVLTAVGKWSRYADNVDIPEQIAERIGRTHRVTSLAGTTVARN